MWLMQKVLLIMLITLVSSKRDNHRGQPRNQERKADRIPTSSEEDEGINLYFARNISQSPTTTSKPKQDEIVEKFIESLVASEKYYKVVESLERKLRHLEIMFNERSNKMIKHLLEIRQLVKSSPSEFLEIALRSMNADLEKLRNAISKSVTHPKLRGKYLLTRPYDPRVKEGLCFSGVSCMYVIFFITSYLQNR
ncbi:unnamed protein product [Diatraea saccharalis]|uniref:Uncharacterized protein n=1 Tax=Diatraea saccharalis TaxID=40085 RepID=A0A9N9N1N1_9NEOP|nr:unnamed protein product [Diatraea saccharalis]